MNIIVWKTSCILLLLSYEEEMNNGLETPRMKEECVQLGDGTLLGRHTGVLELSQAGDMKTDQVSNWAQELSGRD